jgi:3-deoxy-D-manno-octulosonic-acid transferase
MEVAGLARPMCFGPYVENFADAAEKLLAAEGAVQMPGAQELAATLGRLLDDSAAARAMGRRAQEVVRQNVGATTRTVDLLCKYLSNL